MTIPIIRATTIRGAYDELLPIFQHRDRRKIQPNTYARIDRTDITVRYHETDILTYHGDDTVTIDSGGWHTTTTANRYGNWLPRLWSVHNDRGVWNVFGPVSGKTVTYGLGTSYETTYPRTAAHFRLWDGMIITDRPRPLVVNFRQAPDFETVDTLARQLVGMIDDYVELYDAQLCADFLPDDSEPISLAGDCLFCLVKLEDNGHLLSHLVEGYTMLSLLRNAYAARGYQDPDISLHIDLYNGRWVPRVRDHLRRYLTAQLVPYGVPTVSQSDLDYATSEVA